MPEFESGAAEAEHRHHHYSGNEIPWYVHFMWVSFWCLAVYYTITYLIPVLQRELVGPP